MRNDSWLDRAVNYNECTGSCCGEHAIRSEHDISCLLAVEDANTNDVAMGAYISV